MAYGIWLFKTIETQHGDVTLYIKKRNYTGEAIEINALAPDSLTLSIDGDKLTDPIIGSTLTFGIIDTEQIDTTQFFTPDATLYAVELYRGGVLEWSGYLTPDSYQENLSYRDTISLVARDNLGRLEEFKIEEYQGLQNIEILIDSFLAEVGCPQVLNWQCDKVATEKGEGVEIDTPIRDMWVNTRLWIGKTYRDAVEDILKGLGCQMRFAGNNNLVIVSISDFAEFANQSAIFINKSGHKEIIPAWRDATITQDCGLIENFFDGQIKESDMGAKTYFIPYEVANGWYNTSSRGAEIYFANQWMWKNNIEDDQSDSLYPVAKSGGGMASWGVMVNSTNSILTLKMKINNTLRRLANLVFDSTSNLHVGGDNLPSYSLVYQFKIQLKKADGTIYDMTKGGWETSSPSVITFAAEECNYNDEGTWNKDIDVSITINSIPFDGELLIGIGSVMYEGYPDDIVYFGKIKDITLSFNNNIGQKSSRVQIDTKHNINGEVQINVGQVPSGKGDYLAYAGGLFAADGEPLSFFKRKTNDILAYNLLELVGRENIHLQKRNFVALSGEMTAKDTTITLGANIAYKGKYYALISASLNILRNTLSVTRMQEVEDYQIAELTIIDSPLESSQGNKVGSGNNEVIQFSNDAGNAKRLYELQDATEQDQEGAYIIIDKSSMDSAKKLPISAISSALNKAFKVHYNSDGTIKSIEALANFWTNFGITAGGEGTGSGGGTGGATSLEGLNDVSLSALDDGQSLVWSSTLNKWINKTIESGLDEDALSTYLIDNDYAVKGDIPSSLKSPYKLLFGDKSYDGSAEITITAADLGALTEHQSLDGYVNTIETTGNGNAVTSVVKNGKKLTFTKGATYLTTHQDISHLLSKEKAADTYQVKGNYLTSITSKMVTDALTYTPLANTTKYALSDSVGGNALDSAKLGGQLPAYYATATSVTKVADDLSTFKTLFDSMFEKKDGKIHAKLTLWTDYALVAGGEGDGTGGGGGGLTAFSVIINNKTYNSDNGVATITEQLQPLITANNKLAYSLISGTPTSLPASDVYAWAKKSSLAASDVPNLDWSKITSGKPTTLSGYGITDGISTSGGTIEGGFGALSIKRNVANASGIKFENANGVIGYIGIDADGSPCIWDSSLSTKNPLIHFGNYSSYALPLSGGTISNSNWGSQLTLNGEGTDAGLKFTNSGNFRGLLYTNNDGRLGWYDMSGADHTLIHTGNIGSYGGNIGAGLVYFQRSGANCGYIGLASGSNNDITISTESSSKLWLNGNGNTIMNYYGGNVGIGTTDPQYKLDVNGTIRGVGIVYADSGIRIGSSTIGDVSIGVTNAYHNYYIGADSSCGYIYSSNGGYMIAMHTNTGNITIGSNSDSGDKLYVAGSARLMSVVTEFSDEINRYGGMLHLQYRGSGGGSQGATGTSHITMCANGGNVLVGTIADNGAKLQVAGGIHISRTNFFGSYDEGIRIEGASYDWCGIFLGTSSERTGYQNSQWYLLKTNVDTLRIGRGESSTSYLEINEYGKIGIGKINQEYELDIEGSIRTTTGNVRVHHTNSDMCLELLHTHSTYSWNYIRQVSNGYEWHIGILSDVGTSLNDGSDWLSRGAYEIRGNGGKGMNGIFVRYDTSNYGKLVVANSSNYETSIGYLNTNYSRYHPVWTVGTSIGDGDVTTFGWFFANTEAKAWLTSSGNFYVKGAITAGTASDRRLKDNICTINQNQAIEVLMALNPITFNWNNKARELGGFEGISQGFVAQEYESLIPDSGRAIWGKYRAIDYTKVIPYIVSVEQNHEQRIKELEQELQRLKEEYYGIQ